VARFEPDEPGPGPAFTSLETSTPPEIFRARIGGLRPFVP
jgi:hypothetical protein